MTLPGLDGVYALGDAAAVPDLAKGGTARSARPPPSTPCGRAASPRTSSRRCAASRCSRTSTRTSASSSTSAAQDAVSKPLGIELRGLPAQARGPRLPLAALRTNVAKARVMTNWLLNAFGGDDFVRTGFLPHPGHAAGLRAHGRVPDARADPGARRGGESPAEVTRGGPHPGRDGMIGHVADRITAACDGASKGNPGRPPGPGSSPTAPASPSRWEAGPLGTATNNVAELTALEQLLQAPPTRTCPWRSGWTPSTR